MTAAEGYSLVVPIEVRFKDIDMMGHVNNAVYLTYFENARAAYWKALGGWDGRRPERTYVLARAECDYRSPATMEDDLGCHIRVTRLGRTSFAFQYLLRDEKSGRTIVEGRTVQTMYDYDKGKPRPIDDELRGSIRRFEKGPIEEGRSR
jgi:acyl-CoA thioester hydrolase